MRKSISRRDALKSIGHLALSTTALGSFSGCSDAEEGGGGGGRGPSLPPPPPPPPDTVPDAGKGARVESLGGVHAYAQKSVFAGDTIDFRISSTEAYGLDIVRLGWTVDQPERDWVLHRFPRVENPIARSIRPGSYVDVAQRLPENESLPQLSVECWVRPYADTWQGLITQHTYPSACGFGLFLGPGQVVAYVGDGAAFNDAWLLSSAPSLSLGEWHHVVMTFDSGTVALWVDGQQRSVRSGYPQAFRPGAAPLRLAAYADDASTRYTLDGDLAMPVIYSRALSPSEIQQRASVKPPSVPTGPGVIGCWPFSEEAGATVRDVGPAGRHGTIVNHATWMVGGPGFEGPADRLTPYDPQSDPTRGHGIRFASDDLYDCGWPITHSYAIPRELPPGLYVGRIHYGDSLRYDVTFVVRRAPDKPAPRILVLCSTNTWLAYNVPFPNAPWARDGWELGGPRVTLPGAPAFNLYNDHSASQPTYQVGVNMPWGIAAPYVRYLDANLDYSHLVRSERYLHVWLEKNGYDFDVAGDLDLDRNPDLLDRYDIVIVNGHSEYWSAPAYDGLQRYLEKGRNLVVASGNTMFWRVSFDATGAIMECRKMPSGVGGSANAMAGELYHSHDGRRGGLLRECDRPEWLLTGLECVGYATRLFPPYNVTRADHALFHEPESIALQNGDPIGRDVGHEYDVRVTAIPGSVSPAVPPGYNPIVLADRRLAPVVGDYFDYHANAQSSQGGAISEMVYYERPTGGRVLSAGSIAAGRGIAEDPKMGAFMRNVLHRFGAVHRLDLFALDANRQLRTKLWDGTAWKPSLTGWDNLGGQLQSAPVGIFFGGANIAVMGIDPAGRLAYKWRDDAGWHPSTGFVDLGGQLRDRPCAVDWGGHRLNIFARGNTGDILTKWWDGASWGPSLTEWRSLGGAGAGSPTATAWHGNRLAVAALSASRSVIYKWWDGEAWNPSLLDWTDLGGQMQFGPTLFSWGGNRINVLAVDDGGQLLNKWWDGQNWGPSITEWHGLGGELASAPVVAVREGDQFSIFALWKDGTIRAKWWDGQKWGPSLTEWQNLGGNFVEMPAARAWRGGWISIMGITADGRAHYKWWDGGRWNPSDTGWQEFGDGLASGAAILAWVGK